MIPTKSDKVIKIWFGENEEKEEIVIENQEEKEKNEKKKEDDNNDDLGKVTILVTIGNINFDGDLNNLGSSFNLFPLFSIRNIGNFNLEPSTKMLQLEDKSIINLVGIVKDVVVKVKKIISNIFCGD